MKKLCNVGIYCRLSVDDASNSAKAKNYIPADESVSIENQRELLSKFVMLNGWIEKKTYIDDGYSGGNFQRPGFQAMLEDARSGVINLILVKDLSRLGRDFVEVGRYTDVVFPSLGCRFVSVLDCLDSEGDNTDMLHFRSLMNDYHLRDLSSKIKSVLYSKKASGQFTSAFEPYGYQRSAEDKHTLVIDEYAAGIVRRIFDMRSAGMAYGKITAALNQEGVMAPRAYWYKRTGRDGCRYANLWTEAMVKNILRNEVYIGTLRMNHTGSRSYKDKTQIEKPESEWIRIENAHEPVIDKEQWGVVQEMNAAVRRRYTNRNDPTPKLFSHKLICADCHKPMVANTETKHQGYSTVKRYVSYSCSTYHCSGRCVCSWHRIYEITLARIVSSEIRNIASAVELNESEVIEKLQKQLMKDGKLRLAVIQQDINNLRRHIRELEDKTAKLYEDKVGGVISEDTFTILSQKIEQERIEKAERLDTLLSEMQKAEADAAAITDWTALIRKYTDIQTLDRDTIDALIDHIEIGERTVIDGKRQQDIKIYYCFVGFLADTLP